MPTFKHRKLVLKQNSLFQYLLFPSTQEEVTKAEELFHRKDNLTKEEKDLYPLLPDLNMCGKLSEVSSTSHVIDLVHKIDSGHYKCYCGEEADIKHNLILHEDPLSSFKCACQSLQADYFIVIKVARDRQIETFKKEIEELETKIKEHGRDTVSDTNNDTEVRAEDKNE